MDEDFFADDATLDALPEDELQALEDAAVRGTQFAWSQVRPQQKHKQQLQYQQYQYYRAGRTPQLPFQLPVGPPQQQQQARYQQRQTEYQRSTPSDYQTLPTLPYPNSQQGQPQDRHQYQPAPLQPSVDNLPSSDDYGFDEATELWDLVAPEAQVEVLPYMGGGEGEVGLVFDEYGDGQQYTNGDDGGDGEEMVGVEGGLDYHANQQLLQQQQESIHMRELKEIIERVWKLRRRLCPFLPNCTQSLIITHEHSYNQSAKPSSRTSAMPAMPLHRKPARSLSFAAVMPGQSGNTSVPLPR